MIISACSYVFVHLPLHACVCCMLVALMFEQNRQDCMLVFVMYILCVCARVTSGIYLTLFRSLLRPNAPANVAMCVRCLADIKQQVCEKTNTLECGDTT